MYTAAGAPRLRPELRTRAMPESARPFRKQDRHRERRRRVWRFLLRARLLRAPGQIAARPSRARRPFESHRRSRRIARTDRAAERGRAGREFEALRSLLCGTLSIRQLGLGSGRAAVLDGFRRAPRPGRGAATTKTKARV